MVNKEQYKNKEKADKVMDYRIESIITFDHVLIIISVMFLCSHTFITLFEKSCFFITIIIILFEHRYIDRLYIKYKDDNKKFYSIILQLLKHTASISFLFGIWSVLFAM